MVLKHVYALLSRPERLQLVGLGAAMILTGVVEMLGVASVLPFMQLVSDPSALAGDGWLADAYARFGFSSPANALFASGIFLLVVIGLNNLFSATTFWLVQRYAWGLNHRISKQLLSTYLNQDYAFFLGRNTSGLNRTLLAAIHSVVTGVLIPMLQVATRGFTSVLIVVVLALVDFRLAVLLGLAFGGAYAVVYALVRRSQHRLGWEQFNNNGRRFTIAQEALGGIKDVKTLGREAEFMRRFDDPSRRYSVAAAHNQIVSRIPRFALETVAFGGILVIVLLALRRGQDVSLLLPQLTLYAFAGYRLMPALNEVFSSVITIRFNTAALEALHEDLTLVPGSQLAGALLDAASPAAEASSTTSEPRPTPPLADAAPRTPGRRSSSAVLALEAVDFRYPGADADTLTNVTLSVEPREVVGLVGVTGAGKTTLVDVVLGLLRPTGGTVCIDGAPMSDGAAWRARCGYVPQDIFMSDDSISANIAFGIPTSEVREDAVREAAQVAQIHDFIGTLAEGYDTVVGERGVRLSGGQRQRIGIARALYHDPDVLVMDEATNALDSITETAVIDTIHTLAHKKTLIVIAHRLSTVRDCDRIYVLDGGGVAAAGTFDELYESDSRFRAMVGDGA